MYKLFYVNNVAFQSNRKYRIVLVQTLSDKVKLKTGNRTLEFQPQVPLT